MTRSPAINTAAALLLASGVTCVAVVVLSVTAGPPEWLTALYDCCAPSAGSADDTGGPVGFLMGVALLGAILLWSSAALYFGWRLQLRSRR